MEFCTVIFLPLILTFSLGEKEPIFETMGKSAICALPQYRILSRRLIVVCSLNVAEQAAKTAEQKHIGGS